MCKHYQCSLQHANRNVGSAVKNQKNQIYNQQRSTQDQFNGRSSRDKNDWEHIYVQTKTGQETQDLELYNVLTQLPFSNLEHLRRLTRGFPEAKYSRGSLSTSTVPSSLIIMPLRFLKFAPCKMITLSCFSNSIQLYLKVLL